ncbi:hypothetical protein F2Q69_00006007 [Brassica cretica]|uniref:Uncharacterized protein n=1 Tax=Brassica cretica TaxID=69181 RepID=A0A8S9PK38_BRACR|nr:hypothetical protein F2Q69_00006007 [Brassica cretica]
MSGYMKDKLAALTSPMANAYRNSVVFNKIENLVATFFHRKSTKTSSKINLTGVGIDRCASAYSSFSSSCIDSILFCISFSASGVDVVSIDATKCLSVDAGALLSIDLERSLSSDCFFFVSTSNGHVG